MFNKVRVLIISTAALLLFSCPIMFQTQVKATTTPATSVAQQTFTEVSALDMVAYPSKYLNKYVTVKGKFDKFSVLGLDYKPAMRSSEDYISFLIQRDDVKDHNVPLSELKIFLKKSEAEKNIDLNAGDEVQFSGKVFSTALGDVWMDAEHFKVLSKKEVKK